MSLPTVEPLPDENANLPPARRRRQQRMIVPPGSDDRAEFLIELARKTVPSFDFFLASLLCGLLLGGGLLLDSPALVFLAALFAPFMAPAVGISLGTITGSLRFVLQSLASLLIGSLIVFLAGLLGGFAASLLPQSNYQQVAYHSQFTWAGFLVLGLGAALTTYLVARTPTQKPLITSVAIAYGLYLPVGTAGFCLSAGLGPLWASGLGLFAFNLVWMALLGTVVLAFLGIRPLNTGGYLLGLSYLAGGIAMIALVWNTPLTPITAPVETEQPVALVMTETPAPSETPTATPSLEPTITQSPTITLTRTLVPSATATQTITPIPTPVWARVNASEGNGALIRRDPTYDSPVVLSILNGNLIEVLPDEVTSGSVTWIHVRTVDGREGWIVRGLLRTATPAPEG
jgi:hypothetical protein